MHPSRTTILIGAAMCLVAIFMPIVSLPLVEDVSGIDGDAWPVLIWLALPVAFSVLGDRAEGLRPVAALIVIVSSAVGVFFAVAKLIDARAAIDLAADMGPGRIGIGGWLLAAGALVVLAGAVASTSRRVAA